MLSEIRRPEELSLARPLEEAHLKFNYGERPNATVTSGVDKSASRPRRRITLPSMGGGGSHHHHSSSNGHHHNGHRATSTHSLLLDPSGGAAAAASRPDTNTFVSTLGRKTSTMSLGGGGGKFRSLSRNGNAAAFSFSAAPSTTPVRRRSEHSGPLTNVSKKNTCVIRY